MDVVVMTKKVSTPGGKKVVELSLSGLTVGEIMNETKLSRGFIWMIRSFARKVGVPVPLARARAGGNEKWKALGR